MTWLIYGSDGNIIGEKSMSDREFLAPLLDDGLVCACGEREVEDGGEFGFYTADDGKTRCNACGSVVA